MSHKKKNMINSLDSLVQLRGIEVDKIQADLASQEATRARYARNLERLHALAEGSGPSGALPLVLALNCGAYKQNVMAMADAHKVDLQLHEANMAVSQRKLTDAWTRRELLGKVLEQHQDAYARELERATRKREDDIATQSWMAGRAA